MGCRGRICTVLTGRLGPYTAFSRHRWSRGESRIRKQGFIVRKYKNLGILNERWHESKKKMGFNEGAWRPCTFQMILPISLKWMLLPSSFQNIYCPELPLELTKTLKVLRVLKRNVFPFESERKQSEHKRATALMHLLLLSEYISCQSWKWTIRNICGNFSTSLLSLKKRNENH